MAVEMGAMELVTAICASCRNIGSAINIECHFGTALHFAAQLNNMSESTQTGIIKTLLHYGGSCSVRNKALHKFPKDLVSKQRPKVSKGGLVSDISIRNTRTVSNKGISLLFLESRGICLKVCQNLFTMPE